MTNGQPVLCAGARKRKRAHRPLPLCAYHPWWKPHWAPRAVPGQCWRGRANSLPRQQGRTRRCAARHGARETQPSTRTRGLRRAWRVGTTPPVVTPARRLARRLPRSVRIRLSRRRRRRHAPHVISGPPLCTSPKPPRHPHRQVAVAPRCRQARCVARNARMRMTLRPWRASHNQVARTRHQWRQLHTRWRKRCAPWAGGHGTLPP